MSSERLLYQHTELIEGYRDEFGIKISEQTILSEVSYREGKQFGPLSYCFPQPLQSNINTHIPYRNIIWCQPLLDGGSNQDEIEITYVVPIGNQSIETKSIQIRIMRLADIEATANQLSHEILSKSYKNHIISPSVLVIINPHGGQGKAVSIYEQEVFPILKAANAKVTYMETKYQMHAVEIGETLDISKYDIIACCSGDGIPHEIINGFYKRRDKGVEAFNKLAITQLPCGSGNALSLSTHGSNDASLSTFQMLKAHRTKLDLMAVTQGVGERKVTKLSFLSQCYGVIADSDIGTEHLRWLGPLRFDLGVGLGILRRAKYPCDLYVQYVTRSKQDIVDHFDSHFTQESTGSESDDEPCKLPLITTEDLQISGPELDGVPPSSWIKLPESVSRNLNILYVGKMPYVSNDVQFFPAALPNDGTMDLIVTDTTTSIVETASILFSINEGSHVHNDNVHHSKILAYRLIPKLVDPQKHYISVDGESFPFEALQVEVVPGILTGLLQDGKYVETCFKK